MFVSAGYYPQCVSSYFTVDYKLIFFVFLLIFLCSFTSAFRHIKNKKHIKFNFEFFSFFLEYAYS